MNFKSQWLPYATDSDVEAVKRLSRSATDDLKDKINSYDPHFLFEEAGSSRNPDKRKIICPVCGNGKGRDATPVEVEFKGDRWLYHCFRECGFQGDLLKIIADEERLNLHDFNDMCKALAIGAQLIGYPLDSNLTYSTKKKKSPPKKKRETPSSELPLIQIDITDSQNHLDELPDSDRRGLTLETYQHFGCGYLDKWSHPKIRLEKEKAFPTRRIIIPTADKAHYLAALLLSDRPNIDMQYWKMHAGVKTELFNLDALKSNNELILVVEGEIDAMSIWQASDGNLAVVATLSVGGYKELLLPLIDKRKITGKKFLILFDNDDAGKSNAENLRGELSKRNIPTISRFLFDFLSQADQTELGNKIDANELLITRGDKFLNELVSKIIEDSQADFAIIEKEIADTKLFNQLVIQWRNNHKNASVDPKIIAELKDAKAYVDNLTPENFNPDDVFNISIRRKIALCKFYLPQFAATFFNVMRDARDSAKKKIKDSDNPSTELKNLANLVPSKFAIIVDEVVTTIKRDQKEDAGAATTELNVLEKCRLAIVEELPQGGRLDVAKFKSLTGGDKIPVRRLHEEFHNIDPTHKLMLSGNHMPILSDTRDPGLLRRLLNMLFSADFTKNPDTLLKKKLLAPDSLAAMLSLLVDAAQLFYRDGLIIADSMREQTRSYLAENDFIYDFISEYCQRGQNLSIPRQQFLERLKEKCSDECFQQFKNSDRALTDAIKRIDGISYRRTTGGERKFFGIGWNNGGHN